MKMQNLDQIRAKNAFEATKNQDGTPRKFGGEDGGEVVKKVTVMIRDNGILGASAFAKETGKGYAECFNIGIIRHLREIKKSSAQNLDAFLMELANAESTQLRYVTAESLAYLDYLRRFAEKPKKGE